MASLLLFAKMEPIGELGIFLKASSLGARTVISFWNERFAYTSPKLSIRAANWVIFVLPLSSCVRSCVCCCANTARASERRRRNVERISMIIKIVRALRAQASLLKAGNSTKTRSSVSCNDGTIWVEADGGKERKERVAHARSA